MSGLRRLTDGVLFQAVLTGSLSFSHIHDLAAAHGQTGWKAWLYPLSVDLLTVAAYRKLTAARAAHNPAGLAWCSFLLGLAASLAANIAGSWPNPDRMISVSLGVWPAVAFLFCTLLSHDPHPDPAATTKAVRADPAPAAVPEPPAPAIPAPTPAPVAPPAPVAVPASIPAPVAVPAAPPTPELAGVAPAFLTWARKVADQHQQTTGAPIDAGTLRAKLRVAEPLALAVHRHLMTQP